jgi:hypothetical protein
MDLSLKQKKKLLSYLGATLFVLSIVGLVVLTALFDP